MAPYATITSTDFTYTGQRALPNTGLMDYHARFYSPALKRFIQPDTLIPGAANPQSWNRFSYVLNNPINATDPSGHKCVGEPDECLKDDGTRGGGFTGKNSSNNNGSDFDVVIKPKPEKPTCDACNQPQSPEDYLRSLIPFSSLDACNFLLHDYRTCNTDYSFLFNASDPNSINNMLHVLFNSNTISPILSLGSYYQDFAQVMHWVHYPIVGIGLDTASQLADDSGKGYTFWQEVSRVGIHVGEGQISSFAGAAAAGTDAIPGAITGPGDVIIIGGSYVVGSAATSFWLNQLNGAVVNRWPGTTDYVPYEPVPDWLINK